MNFNINLTNLLIFSMFNALNVFTCHYFFKIFLNNYKCKSLNLICYYSIFFICSTIIFFSLNLNILSLIFNLIMLLILSLNYDRNLKYKILSAFTIGITSYILEITILTLYSNITKEVLYLDDISVFLFAISRFILFNFVNSLYHYINKTDNILKTLNLLELVLMPIVSVSLFIVSGFYLEFYQATIFAIITITLITTLLFNLYNKLLEKSYQEIEKIIITNENKYYINLYETITLERKEIFKVKHNFTNHLISIKSSLKENDTTTALNEIDSILNYKSEVMLVSNIMIIDAIVNYKTSYAKKFDINFNIKIDIVNKLALDNTIIANILGNALDNAIEACKFNKNPNNKTIELIIIQDKDNLYIQIANTYEHKLKVVDGIPTTTKNEPNSYSIGIKTMLTLADENNGVINIDFDNNIFKVEVVFFECFEI